MAQETLTVDNDGPVALITLRREKALNALNRQLLSELGEALSSLTGKGARAAVLTGAGEKAFVAGADIAEMAELGPAEARAFAESGHRIGDLIASLPIPVIAAVNGFALGGGCELALACDFIYASDKAKFGQPEVNLGLIPGFGGTQRLLRRVGPARAAELVLTADLISADEALRIGLVNAVVPATELVTRACAQARKIAGKAPLAIAAAKRALRRAEELSLSAGNELERELFASLFATADQKEGTRAFVEKRTANWTGR
jgi:enoyl-CoA hydratase